MGGFYRNLTGSSAAKASKRGAAEAVEGQERGLDYLMEKEALPRQFSEGALQQLGGLFGVGGDPNAMQNMQNSPIYQQIMSNQGSALAAGEDSILRNASMTGGLRSGNTQDALSRYAGDLNTQFTNQAMQSSLAGLQGLSGIGSDGVNIANAMAGIGNTRAQGTIGAAQTKQDAYGQIMSAASGAAAGGAFSDARLKDNVKPQGDKNGHKWYSWTWSEEAEALGLSGPDEGVMAHEVALTRPDAVTSRNGYLVVDYKMLGVQ